jgi:predicted nucleic acid-binding Zn ribbon protein
MKDIENIVLSVLKTPAAREKYILFVLRKAWPDIIGSAAAAHSQPYRLEKGVLYIHTDNPAWSNNLWMMKGKLLAAIDPYLPRKNGRRMLAIRDFKIFHGIIQEDPADSEEDESPFMPHLEPDKRCPVCGVPLITGEKICSSCDREQKMKQREKIQRILEKMPWISFEDCQNYVVCDKMTFIDVKAPLTEWALTKAFDSASPLTDKAFAVMLLKGSSPEQLTDEKIEKILEREKRIRHYVSSSGK